MGGSLDAASERKGGWFSLLVGGETLGLQAQKTPIRTLIDTF